MMTHKGGERRRVKGYGKFHMKHAHVAALELKLGRPLQKGCIACHTCDNVGCVNFDHLYEGTHKTNKQDMKERQPEKLGTRYHKKYRSATQ